jgi:hypothetical protein
VNEIVVNEIVVNEIVVNEIALKTGQHIEFIFKNGVFLRSIVYLVPNPSPNPIKILTHQRLLLSAAVKELQ